MKKVDWVPFMTRHVVDDFASHLRLYRMARENVENANSKKDKEQKGGLFLFVNRKFLDFLISKLR